MSKSWQLSKWEKRRKEFIKGKTCEWCGSKIILTIHHPQERNTLTDAKYESFEGTIILCRRCHFALHKKMHLCPNCKKKYVPNRFNVCFDCLPSERKEGIKSWREEQMKETEEEVPLVEVTLPCGSKVMVYSDQWEWGGMLETCMHQWPNPVIQGDVNNCGHFKKFYDA